MKNNRYLPMTLIAAAIISGCSSTPQNASLMEAHYSFNNARASADISNQAPLELKVAGETLNQADAAFNKDEDESVVDHLAYMSTQQVAIARETAKRKVAEMAVANAAAMRNEVRLDARTNEANSAERKLAEAGVDSARDHALIAQQEMELQALNAEKTERGYMITLGDVLFRTDRAQLQPGGMHNVEKLGDFLSQYQGYKVLVEGYTDSTGSHNHNQQLSDRRAYAVRTALVDMNIGSERIKTRGYAEEYPVADNNTASNRQLNRRVEIILSDNKGNIAQR